MCVLVHRPQNVAPMFTDYICALTLSLSTQNLNGFCQVLKRHTCKSRQFDGVCHARGCFYVPLLLITGIVTDIQREVSKVTYMISKTINTVAKILAEINQEMGELRTTVL